MSVSNPDSRQNSNNQQPQDPFVKWQFRIFQIVVFIIAIWAMWKFLNEHVPIAEAIRRFFHWLGII